MSDETKQEQDRTGPVSDDEAEQIARRYNASHFRNHGDLGERARYSIPADPKRDDDIRFGAYIAQTRALRHDLEVARELLRLLYSGAGKGDAVAWPDIAARVRAFLTPTPSAPTTPTVGPPDAVEEHVDAYRAWLKTQPEAYHDKGECEICDKHRDGTRPPKCEAWCGEWNGSPLPGALQGGRHYCTSACSIAGRPLNPPLPRTDGPPKGQP